jgi:hypothetical protein
VIGARTTSSDALADVSVGLGVGRKTIFKPALGVLAGEGEVGSQAADSYAQMDA